MCPGWLSCTARQGRGYVARFEFVLLSAAGRILDDRRDLPVGDLVLDLDHGVHRYLPQPGPVRLGQGTVVLVRADHPADRCSGLPDRPWRLDASTDGAAGAAAGSAAPRLRPGDRRFAKSGGPADQAR